MSVFVLDPPALMTRAEVADALRLSPDAVTRFSQLGKLPAPFYIGNRPRWHAEEIRKLIDRQA
jgi:hypothetical protein